MEAVLVVAGILLFVAVVHLYSLVVPFRSYILHRLNKVDNNHKEIAQRQEYLRQTM